VADFLRLEAGWSKAVPGGSWPKWLMAASCQLLAATAAICQLWAVPAASCQLLAAAATSLQLRSAPAASFQLLVAFAAFCQPPGSSFRSELRIIVTASWKRLTPIWLVRCPAVRLTAGTRSWCHAWLSTRLSWRRTRENGHESTDRKMINLSLNHHLKGLSHEIDFKNVDSNLQNLA